MKNYQKGFVVPILIIFAVLTIGGGVYYYSKSFSDKKNVSTETQSRLNNNSETNSLSFEDFKIWPLGSIPDGISKNKTSKVCFTSMITGKQALNVKDLSLEVLDHEGNLLKSLGKLLDDEKNCDLSAGDLVFSGQFSVVTTEQGFIYFRATKSFPNGTETSSEIYKLVVTNLPTELSPSDMTKVILDPDSGNKLLSNEVLVSFVDGTSDQRIEVIVKDTDGIIVGSIPGLGTYQIRFKETGDITGIKNIITSLKKFKEVKWAEPNYIASVE